MPFQFQTTKADIRSGWTYFEAWKRRFWKSTRRWNATSNAADWLYLANWQEVQNLDSMDGDDFHDIDEAVEQKTTFLKAYLSIVALDSHRFGAQTKRLLKLQSRLKARETYGFWFWQSDMEKFGPGVSREFQYWQGSIFCDNAKQIDFSTIMAILPHDNVLVRHPSRKWSKSEAGRLVRVIQDDLAFDGIETKIDFSHSYDLLVLDIISPEHGQDMTANRLRTFRASEARDEVMATKRRPRSSVKKRNASSQAKQNTL